MVYGYSNGTVNEFGLHELREVTLVMTPSQLSQLGDFLYEMAKQMESGALRGEHAHRHLTTMNPEWKVDHPSADIVVVPARSDA